MSVAPQSQRAKLRREFADATEDYFRAISDAYSDEHRVERLRRLGRVAIRLHFFEQGRRSAR